MGNTQTKDSITLEEFKDQIFSATVYLLSQHSNPEMVFVSRTKTNGENLPLSPIKSDNIYEIALNYYNNQEFKGTDKDIDYLIEDYVTKHIIDSKENVSRFYKILVDKLRMKDSNDMQTFYQDTKSDKSTNPKQSDRSIPILQKKKPVIRVRSQQQQGSGTRSHHTLDNMEADVLENDEIYDKEHGSPAKPAAWSQFLGDNIVHDNNVEHDSGGDDGDNDDDGYGDGDSVEDFEESLIPRNSQEFLQNFEEYTDESIDEKINIEEEFFPEEFNSEHVPDQDHNQDHNSEQFSVHKLDDNIVPQSPKINKDQLHIEGNLADEVMRSVSSIVSKPVETKKSTTDNRSIKSTRSNPQSASRVSNISKVSRISRANAANTPKQLISRPQMSIPSHRSTRNSVRSSVNQPVQSVYDSYELEYDEE